MVQEVLSGPAHPVNQSEVAAALGGRLQEIFAGRPRKVIQVAGRPGVSYANVIDAMDVAKSAGISVIGIVPKDSVSPNR
jgi:biopolymer transport protein ExbD